MSDRTEFVTWLGGPREERTTGICFRCLVPHFSGCRKKEKEDFFGERVRFVSLLVLSYECRFSLS